MISDWLGFSASNGDDGVGSAWQVPDDLGVVGWVCRQAGLVFVVRVARQVVTVGGLLGWFIEL